MSNDRVYILYDSRAAGGVGTEEASVLVACDDEEEAKSYQGEFDAMSCYSYCDKNGQLTDEQFEWDWYGTERVG